MEKEDISTKTDPIMMVIGGTIGWMEKEYLNPYK